MKSLARLPMVLIASTVSTTSLAEDGSEGLTNRAERDIVQAMQVCRKRQEDSERLACFDELARKNAPPTYSGKLGFKTKLFELNEPHFLRYRSDGVIFVLYLFDEKGDVVQNLHIGGGGEDTFLIEKPGIYSLQIDGSAAWKIWIDPARAEN